MNLPLGNVASRGHRVGDGVFGVDVCRIERRTMRLMAGQCIPCMARSSLDSREKNCESLSIQYRPNHRIKSTSPASLRVPMGNLDRAFDVGRYQQVSLFYERRLTKVLNQNPIQHFGQPLSRTRTRTRTTFKTRTKAVRRFPNSSYKLPKIPKKGQNSGQSPENLEKYPERMKSRTQSQQGFQAPYMRFQGFYPSFSLQKNTSNIFECVW